MSEVSLRVRVARSVHRLLLRLAPRDIRREQGDQMSQTFGDLVEAAGTRGWLALGRLLAREAVDLVAARRLNSARGRLDSLGTPDERNTMTSLFLALTDWRALGRSARALWRRRAFALTATLTLALGTAATTALFSVVDTVLVKPLPYPEADRLVTVMEASRSATAKTSLVAPVRLDDWSRMSRTFVAISGAYSENVTDTSGTTNERLEARRVAPRYFLVYRAAPILGRTFADAEEHFGGPTAAMISEAFWTRRFARDPGALTQSLHIGGQMYPIVGVMPATFTSATVDVWLPAQTPPFIATLRSARFFSGIGRLKAGVTSGQAQDDLDRAERELAVQFPADDKDWATAVSGLKSARIGDRAQELWLLFGAVGLLWLIALANVAALVLVEMRRRQRELAVRAALGASRGRIVGAVLQEVLLLCLIAGAIGAAGSIWMVAGIRATFLTLPRINELQVDGRAFAFAAGTSVLAALLCGLAPAVLATRRLVADLTRGGRGVAGGAHRLQRFLVVAQVALSVLLCVSATLLVRSYDNLTRVNSGFTAEGAYTFHVGARWDEDRTAVGHLQERLVEGIQQQPGVLAVGMTNFLPLPGATLRYQVKVSGMPGTDPNGFVTAGSRTVSAGYLEALKVPILAGAPCPAFRFDPNAPLTVLVNRRFVDRFAAGQNLIGRELRFAQYVQTPQTIVGVVADVAEDGPAADAVPYVYACARPGAWPDPQYVVRAADPERFAAALRPLVRQIDPSRAVFGYRPLSDALQAAVDEPRMTAGLTTLFAVTALTLAAIGLYGLFMLIVSEGRREIGVRLALGAAPTQMVGLVCASAGRLLVLGVIIGLGLTLGTGRVLKTLLFGVSTYDAGTLAVATMALVVVSSTAIAIPAIRASRVAPTEALRTD
jgi:putative ABC transport system permease protein